MFSLKQLMPRTWFSHVFPSHLPRITVDLGTAQLLLRTLCSEIPRKMVSSLTRFERAFLSLQLECFNSVK